MQRTLSHRSISSIPAYPRPQNTPINLNPSLANYAPPQIPPLSQQQTYLQPQIPVVQQNAFYPPSAAPLATPVAQPFEIPKVGVEGTLQNLNLGSSQVFLFNLVAARRCKFDCRSPIY